MASTILSCTAPNFPNDQGQRLCPGCAQMHTPVFTHHPTPLTLSTTTSPPPPADHPITTTNINLQTASPLYNLPSELLTLILTHVFLAAPDPTQQYKHTTRSILPPIHHPRISYPYRSIIHTSALQTCKLLYFPHRHLPLSLNEHVFWPRDFREPIFPPQATYPIHTGPYFKKLLDWQRECVREVRFNIPEQGVPSLNVINSKIARVFLKKKIAGLVGLGGLKVVVWDCHNPVFWGDAGVGAVGGVEVEGRGRFEKWREENMYVNFGEAVEGFEMLVGDGLKELRIVVDHREGSKVWGFVKGLVFRGLRLVDDGSGGEEKGKEEGNEGGYGLKILRFVV